MPVFELEYGGKTLELEANTPEQAATAARLYFAGRGKADDVAQEANLRGQAAVRDRGLDDPLSPEFQALRERGQMEGTAAAAGPTAAILGAGVAGGLAPAGFIPGMLKDTVIYGAAEGAEKLLGLPSWTGEALGAISPVKSLGKLLLGGAVGGAKRGATAVAAEGAEALASREAAKTAERETARAAAERLAEKKLELEARKVAAREAESAARVRAIEERTRAQVAAMQERAARSGAPRSTRAYTPKAAPKTSGANALEPEFIDESAVTVLPFKPKPSTAPADVPFLADDAVSVVESRAASSGAPIAQEGIPGDVSQIAMQIQQKTGMLRPDGAGMRGGKAMVQAELDKLPPGVREQVEAILARGQGHPATVASGGTRSVGTAAPSVSKPLSDPLLEFARQAAKGEAPGVNPVRGSKIWIELDPAGKPIGVLKDGYAHAKRGNSKTWVVNLWGSKTASNVF